MLLLHLNMLGNWIILIPWEFGIVVAIHTSQGMIKTTSGQPLEFSQQVDILQM